MDDGSSPTDQWEIETIHSINCGPKTIHLEKNKTGLLHTKHKDEVKTQM